MSQGRRTDGSNANYRVDHRAAETTPLLRPENPLSPQRSQSFTSSSSHHENPPHTRVTLNADGLQDREYSSITVRVSSAALGIDIEPELERVCSTTSTQDRDRYVGSSANEGSNSTKSTYADRFIDVSPRRFWMIFGGIQVGYVLSYFDSTLMASSHPVITSYFHASNSASWLSTAFLLTSTALMPLFGRVSDTFGRKPVYLFSITVFFVTTLWCAVAQSIGSFIAARAVCGMGAGGVMSMGMVMCSDLVRLEYRGIYQSYINLALGIGGCLGIVLGGLLCDLIGWRGAFGIQLPLIFLYLVVAIATTPANLGLVVRDEGRFTFWQLIRSIDLTGSFILMVTVASLIIGINLGGNVLRWDHPLVICSLVLFGVLAVVLLIYERHVERPVMPVALLSKNPRRSVIFGNFFTAMSVNTVVFNAPLFFQAVRLESPTESGLRLVSSSVGITFSSVLTGFLITWSKQLKPTIVTGGVFLVLGGLCTMLMSIFHLPDALCALILSFSSLGQGFSNPSITLGILSLSSQADQAVATTTLGLWRNLGSVMGVATSSWILQNILLFYLRENVTGPNKEDVITQVRKSVSAIAVLDPGHQIEGAFLTDLKKECSNNCVAE